MISISMFNNKGGVGKTTLTCNIASYFARRHHKRILVIDCDPQCNATQLVMGQEFATSFYWNGPQETSVTTIKDILRPIEEGGADISSEVVPILSSANRFGVDLIPGHPGFSVVEDRLGAAWHDSKGGDIGGLRKTNWNTALCQALMSSYDIIFYDLGPSLGSINRCVLIGCDYFLTPMGADIFSILGVKNIAAWIRQWLRTYGNGIYLCEQNDPGRLSDFKIPTSPKIIKGYLGYTMQQYITKSKGGVRIPTQAYEEILSSVPDIIEESLKDFFKDGLTIEDAKTGEVPHLYSLIPLAQSVASPILELRKSDGLVGSQYKQRDDFERIIKGVCLRIAANVGIPLGNE